MYDSPQLNTKQILPLTFYVPALFPFTLSWTLFLGKSLEAQRYV